MRCLLSISLLVLWGCSSHYNKMQRTAITGVDCIQSFKPVFKTALYNTQVNVIGKHLSGLLIIKTMPDSSTRIVFTSEAGFKFFDFGFSGKEFTVYYIYREMDKKAAIKTLRKDFELVLMNKLNTEKPYVLEKEGEKYYTFSDGKDHYYYVTNSDCSRLIRMERGSKRKKVMTAIAENFNEGMPDTIGITHDNFNFNIGLKRIYNYAEK